MNQFPRSPSCSYLDPRVFLSDYRLDVAEEDLEALGVRSAGELLDFVIVAAVVFVILKAFIKEAKPPPAPPTKTCPQCLETIPEAAKKCRACASAV